MPHDITIKLAKRYSIKLPTNIKIKADFWSTRKAGKLGGIVSYKKYGNPGTTKGRKLGGFHSLTTHQKLNTKFKTRKKVILPKKNEKLSELVGILLGDGSISQYQIGITLNSQTDAKYGAWMSKFISKLFNVSVKKTIRKKNTLQLTIAGINIVEYLLKLELKRGSKIRNQISIPNWIKREDKFAKACLRGLIDTDGCIYIDKHKYKNKTYKNICLDFTSYSKPLLNTTYELLSSLELSPKKYKKGVKIRKEINVKKYFNIIGTHNDKHLKKYTNFFKNKP